jgi:hypothetical protein
VSKTIKFEESVAKVGWALIDAVAEKKTDDEGKVSVAARVRIAGVEYELEDVANFLKELPRAAERAGALAAKLKLDVSYGPYEPPRVVPIGNLKDKLVEICATEHASDDTPVHVFSSPNVGIGGNDDKVKTKLEVVPDVSRDCRACRYSGIEPMDMDLTCGHPDAGAFGIHLFKQPADHCPDYSKFEQHPGRNPDGTIKG